MMLLDVAAQWKAGIEQYKYIGVQSTGLIVPTIHLQSSNKWYAELRYNYEDVQTLSLYAGKTFTGGSGLDYNITPMVGFSIGKFTGVSIATKAETEWKNFYLSSETQYSIAIKNNAKNFFFSWSELGYNISSNFFGGLAMQYTRQEGISNFEPGLVAGISIKNISFPFYAFSPFRPGGYFVIGLNYEYNLKNKKR
jgi:hypothetical protein